MTPQNVAYETERLIATALYHRRPAYMAFPADLANEPVVSRAQPLDLPFSNRPLSTPRSTRSVRPSTVLTPRASCRGSSPPVPACARGCSPLYYRGDRAAADRQSLVAKRIAVSEVGKSLLTALVALFQYQQIKQPGK
jgi:hypothetical protein